MFTIKGKYTTATVHIGNIDETAMAQITKMVNYPYFTEKIEIMPDTHAGKGSVIGFTMPLTGLMAIPNLIGVDISCGMISIRLEDLSKKRRNRFKADNIDYMTKLDTKIRDLVPMGINIHPDNDLDSKILLNDILEKIAKESQEEAIKFSHKFYNKFGTKIIDRMPDYTSDEFFKGILKRSEVDIGRFYRSVGTLGGGK